MPGMSARTIANFVKFYHTENGIFSRERIGSHLRACVRKPRDERGFSGVGKTHKPHVSDELEFEEKFFLLTRLAGRGAAMLVVAVPALSALADDDARAALVEILQEFAGLAIEDLGPGGHEKETVLAGVSPHVARAAVGAFLGFEIAGELEIQ